LVCLRPAIPHKHAVAFCRVNVSLT
jgi:hypothetical protein